MNIFITGINGYLGRCMAAHWSARGHAVRGSSRHSAKLAHALTVEMALGETFDHGVFDGIDVLIHAAHDFTAGAKETNQRGTRAWMEVASKRGIARQIFLSSYSARPDAASEYGQTKYLLEQVFLEAGHAVLRPGLVIGSGGLFAKQRVALLRTPIVPVIGGGHDPVAVIGIGHLLDAATVVLERQLAGPFHLFYEPQPTTREFISAIKTNAGQRVLFLSISANIAIALARIVRGLRLPIPVNPDQISALALNRSAIWHSDLTILLPNRFQEFTLAHALAELDSGL